MSRPALAIIGTFVAVVLGAVLVASTDWSRDPATTGVPDAGTPAAAPSSFDPVSAGEPTPEGFRQVLARDQIPPIYEPEFADADSVDWPDDMLVLGIAGEDEAKAYPITHLNRHEMVNDTLDGEPILATW